MKLLHGLCAGIVAAGLAAGCSDPVSPDQSVPVTTLGQADDSLIANESTFVIRSNADLLAAWRQIHPGSPTSLPPPLPEVDFNTSMLVIVAIGRQPSSGFSVKITSATRERNGIVVHVTISRPGENCGTATVITGPVAIARLPKTDLPVRFEFTRAAIPCR